MRQELELLHQNISSVLLGKPNEIELLICAFLVQGHVLIEDVPGTGKTLLARALAASLNLDFRRIQFSPDMLPSDITGISLYHKKTEDFVFRPGPLFANIVLADEINRASPRTQAAFLEAMEEGTVTVDYGTHPLPEPFFVIATQNPVEMEGTYKLPEAQMDRFLIKMALGYPSQEIELEILEKQRIRQPLDDIAPVMDLKMLQEIRKQVQEIHVSAAARKYILLMVRKTRESAELALGSSPRGSIYLFKMAQAFAFLKNRDYVKADDLRFLAPYVLTHRLAFSPLRATDQRSERQILQALLRDIPIPDDLDL